MIGPYRDPPPIPASGRCEICGIQSERERCTRCLAVEELVPSLEFPVVVVKYNWYLGSPRAGAGFVLIDRWFKIAQCSCWFPFSSGRAVSAIARARAERWAPGAKIASTAAENDEGFAESLIRTRTVDHPAVQQRFESAVSRAIQGAADARESMLVGSRIWPESER